MPTDPDVLGFSNPWYEEAVSTAVTVALASGVEIRAAAPLLLVARPELRDYIRAELTALREEPYFGYAVEGATAGYGSLGADRARLVDGRIDELLA